MTNSALLFSDGIQNSAVARRHNRRRSTLKKWILSIEADVPAPPQFRVLQPVQREQGSLELAELAQRLRDGISHTIQLSCMMTYKYS
jgi:hypothetical protein